MKTQDKISLTPGRVEYLKHPFAKKKFKISDLFESTGNFTCSQCQSVGRPLIYSLESDLPKIKDYIAVKCKGCEQYTWYAIPK